jgi:hypothetical protein
MGPRIAVVAALHQLAAAAGLVRYSMQREPCDGSRTAAGAPDRGFAAAAVSAGVGLWCNWIQVALHDPVLSAENHRHGSEAHRGKVRLWQGVTAAAAFLGCSTQRDAATQAVKGEGTAVCSAVTNLLFTCLLADSCSVWLQISSHFSFLSYKYGATRW